MFGEVIRRTKKVPVFLAHHV